MTSSPRKGALAAHIEAINSGSVTKGVVAGLRKAINQAERERRYGARAWKPKCALSASPAEVWAMEAAIERTRPYVTGELADTGRKLLSNRRFATRWSRSEADQIRDLTGFRLVRFDRVTDAGTYVVPVYQVLYRVPGARVTAEGFCFRTIPWQSGGSGPEIVPLRYERF